MMYLMRRETLMSTAVRELLGGLSTQQIQTLTPTTNKMYEKVAKWNHERVKSVSLGSGALGHWIGPEQANYVMLYFHGTILKLGHSANTF
jgi:hypothetical protein